MRQGPSHPLALTKQQWGRRLHGRKICTSLQEWGNIYDICEYRQDAAIGEEPQIEPYDATSDNAHNAPTTEPRRDCFRYANNASATIYSPMMNTNSEESNATSWPGAKLRAEDTDRAWGDSETFFDRIPYQSRTPHLIKSKLLFGIRNKNLTRRNVSRTPTTSPTNPPPNLLLTNENLTL